MMYCINLLSLPVTCVPTEKSVLYITPTMPSFSGGGLAMRTAATLRLLSLWFREVHLLVLPIYSAGNKVEPEPAINKMLQSWRIIQRRQEQSDVDTIAAASAHWSSLLQDPLPAELKPWNRIWQDQIDAAIAQVPADLAFVFRFYLAPYVLPALQSRMPCWLDIDELESNGRIRLAQLHAKNDTNKALELQKEASAYEHIEGKLLNNFARVFASSSVEADMLRSRSRTDNLDIRVLPNSYPIVAPLPERQRNDNARLLFVGTFGYYPNVDGLLHFARNIFPIIRERSSVPVETVVIGAGLNAAGYVREFPGINFVGPVDETASYYSDSDVAIVPLRCGAGTRIKILEAFSYRRAVVSTCLGAEGFDVADDRELRLADSDELFAQRCLELLNDHQNRNHLAQRGHEFFLRHHSLERLEQMIPSLFEAERAAS